MRHNQIKSIESSIITVYHPRNLISNDRASLNGSICPPIIRGIFFLRLPSRVLSTKAFDPISIGSIFSTELNPLFFPAVVWQ